MRRKGQCLEQIRQRLKLPVGVRNWKQVEDAFPEFPRRTIFRWVEQVSGATGKIGGTGPGKQKPDPAMVETVKNHMRDASDAAAALSVSRNLPAVPPPEFIARHGIRRARKNIDFLDAVNDLWADVLKLREFAIVEDAAAEDGWKIKNPVYFDTSIKRRLDVMDTALEVMREVWDFHFVETFSEEVVKIFVEELRGHPELQQRIAARLDELNERRGARILSERPDDGAH